MKYLAVAKALPKENDFCNKSRIRYHHGNWTEHGFKIIRKLCATSIAWKTVLLVRIHPKTHFPINLIFPNTSSILKFLPNSNSKIISLLNLPPAPPIPIRFSFLSQGLLLLSEWSYSKLKSQSCQFLIFPSSMYNSHQS